MEAILSFGDVVIRNSDLDLLEDGEWLNDTLIEFCYEYLEGNGGKGLNIEATGMSLPSVAFIRPAIVHLLAHGSLEAADFGLQLDKKDVIFLPINDNEDDRAGGGHWSLMVYHRASNAFYYYDSMGKSNMETAKRTKAQLEHSIDTSGHGLFVPIQSPSQINGFDCGVYVIAITEMLAKRLRERGSITEKPGDLSYWRLAHCLPPKEITEKRWAIRNLILSLASGQ